MRLFIGVALAPQMHRPVQKLLKELARKHWPVSWEPLEKLHFTLVFLGEVGEGRLPELKQIVEASCARIKPFTLKVKGIGCFPDYFQPRIIWLGLKGDLTSLAALQKQLKAGLSGQGFPTDAKPFRPHITLGRIKEARFRERREIGRQLKGLRIKEIAVEWRVERVGLYSSQTFPAGSVYTLVEEREL
jgi:2'-5' RNA ligase